MAPSFSGIGKSATKTQGFVLLPVYLPNTSTLSGDKRNAQVLLLWVEFQVVNECKTGFLIGRDATKAYKITIDESSRSITIRTKDSKDTKTKKDSKDKDKDKAIFRIPISENDRFGKRRHDARVLLTQDVNVKPQQEIWLPIRFKRFNDNSSLLFTPNRIVNNEDQTYGSACYSVCSDNTNRLLFLNASDRPIKLPKGRLLGTVEPIQPNTPMSYFNKDTDAENEQSQLPDHQTEQTLEPAKKSQPQSEPPNDRREDHTPEIDPFGLSDDDESTDDNSEKKTKESDPIFDKDDYEWDINPKLRLRFRIAILELLRKRKNVFSGPSGRLGHVKLAKMKILANYHKIKSQNVYRSSPHKQRLI